MSGSIFLARSRHKRSCLFVNTSFHHTRMMAAMPDTRRATSSLASKQLQLICLPLFWLFCWTNTASRRRQKLFLQFFRLAGTNRRSLRSHHLSNGANLTCCVGLLKMRMVSAKFWVKGALVWHAKGDPSMNGADWWQSKFPASSQMRIRLRTLAAAEEETRMWSKLPNPFILQFHGYYLLTIPGSEMC